MAINTDGPKKQGRFLKNSSKLLNHVQLVDFSFEEICTQPLVGFDNSSSTIIHSKFHDPKKLAHVIESTSPWYYFSSRFHARLAQRTPPR